jgi:hypothetical protein
MLAPDYGSRPRDGFVFSDPGVDLTERFFQRNTLASRETGSGFVEFGADAFDLSTARGHFGAGRAEIGGERDGGHE